MADLDELGIPDDDEQKRSLIAHPQPSSLPPVAVRPLGIAPQGAQPAQGSTEDLEAKAAKIPAQMGTSLRTAAQPDTPPPLQARIGSEQNELKRLQDTGSGISQIKNPWARGAARGLNIAGEIGSAIIPQIGTALRAIPGTEEHHQQLIGREQRSLGADTQNAAQGAVTEHTQAETEAIPAETALKEAQTTALGEPKPKEEEWTPYKEFTGTNGEPLEIEKNSGHVQLVGGGVPTGFKAAKAEAPFQTEHVVRIVGGVPHEILVDKQTGADVKDLGQTKVPGESSGDKRAANESAQVERESRVAIRKAEEQYRGTLQSVSQVKQSIDAATDGNGLLTSFVPTMEVLGINASNGVHRISPAEAHAAGVPGGWTEQFNAWFDKASTGKISPQLQKEGKQLADILGNTAHQRYASIYNDEKSIVEGYGGKDFDKRVPMIQGEGGTGQGSGTQKQAYQKDGKWFDAATNQEIK